MMFDRASTNVSAGRQGFGNREGLRLGELLVEAGMITAPQREEILRVQAESGKPFGVLAERMFGVNPRAVERAWATQVSMLAPHTDPRDAMIDQAAVRLVSRRQAWQFRLLPMVFKQGELVVCTTKESLARAVSFACWKLSHRCTFVLAEPGALGAALVRHYPMGGMTSDCLISPPLEEAA